MAIDREQLLHVAHLARLELREDEVERLEGQQHTEDHRGAALETRCGPMPAPTPAPRRAPSAEPAPGRAPRSRVRRSTTTDQPPGRTSPRRRSPWTSAASTTTPQRHSRSQPTETGSRTIVGLLDHGCASAGRRVDDRSAVASGPSSGSVDGLPDRGPRRAATTATPSPRRPQLMSWWELACTRARRSSRSPGDCLSPVRVAPLSAHGRSRSAASASSPAGTAARAAATARSGPTFRLEEADQLGEVVAEQQVGRGQLAEAEVDQPDAPVGGQEDVGQPEVAVGDAVAAQLRDPGPDVDEDGVGELVGLHAVERAAVDRLVGQDEAVRLRGRRRRRAEA